MSHFTVLVIGEDAKKQLAPFQENNMGDCPKEYMKFCSYVDGETQWFGSKEEAKKKLGDKYCEEESYWENPNAKWDWNLLGGRWTGTFKLKNGATGKFGEPGIMTEPIKVGHADAAIKGDIDFISMEQSSRAEAAANWEKAKTEDNTMKYFKYGVEKDDTQDSYIRRGAKFSTFAVIKDGKWYERGEMGWWACVANEKESNQWDEEFNKLIKKLPDDTLLSIYDCHI